MDNQPLDAGRPDTPVGCACGDGVIDWAKVVAILRDRGFNGVLSVECGTPGQAARSLSHLRSVLSEQAQIASFKGA